MTVYVDDMQADFGRLKLCHMIADSEEELHAMADRIGVARKWYQGDHYDVALSKKKLAIEAGAKAISWRDCALMMVRRRREVGAPLVTPAEGLAILRKEGLCGRGKKVVPGEGLEPPNGVV